MTYVFDNNHFTLPKTLEYICIERSRQLCNIEETCEGTILRKPKDALKIIANAIESTQFKQLCFGDFDVIFSECFPAIKCLE